MTMLARRPLRILTWHVHGNYLYYLTQVPHDFYLITDAQRSVHHSGRSGTLPWGPNVHEIRMEEVARASFDVILYQSGDAWDHERHRLLSPAQLRLPQIYLEHDPPLTSPTEARHRVRDPDALLVHVTPFNALMWHSPGTPTAIVEHGVKLLDARGYRGDRQAGLVAINDIDLRGRRMGLDIVRQVQEHLPLALVGMGTLRCGGEGELANQQLPARMAEHRFVFSPIRYTSLGLTFIEAMMIGCPIVGLATAELAAVLRNGDTGFVDTRIPVLIDAMQQLQRDRQLARTIGEAGRRMASERFGIERFVDDWLRVFRSVTT